jgi:hypothetical protein
MLVATILAFAVGGIPACGTMGGGGMKYLWEPVEAPHSLTT